MTAMNWLRGGWLLGALGAGLISTGAALAEVPVERPGSLLIFPKVVNTAARKTVIQLSNSGNMVESVRCFYVDKNCEQSDFEILLTRQQPTHWRSDSGRSLVAPQGGLFPGLIPPLPEGFEGALICASVDISNGNRLVNTNKLRGTATLESSSGGDESRYNAIPVYAYKPPDETEGNTARLDGDFYERCPSDLHLDLFAEQPAPDPVVGTNGTVQTGLTIMSCDANLEQAFGGSFELSYRLIDEFELQHSTDDGGSCLYFVNVAELFTPFTPPTGLFTALSISARDSSIPPKGVGVVAVAENFHYAVGASTSLVASAARTVHDITPGDYPNSTIVVPAQ